MLPTIASPTRSQRGRRLPRAWPARRWLGAWGPLLAVLAVAAALRLWALGGGPDPFDVDEGYTGVDALRVLAGHPTLYFAANNGAEPLYVYLAALSTALLGPSALALRLPAALAGVACVLATYLLVRAVFREEGTADLTPLAPSPIERGGRTTLTLARSQGERERGALTLQGGIPQALLLSQGERGRGGVAAAGRWAALDWLERAEGLALLAALLQAVSLWHVQLSRDASRVGLLPLLGAIAFYCLWRGIEGGQEGLAGHPPAPPAGARPSTPSEGAAAGDTDPRFPLPQPLSANPSPPIPAPRPLAPAPHWGWFPGAGACFGLALYTYLPARLLPLVAIVLVAQVAVARYCTAPCSPRHGLRAWWPGLVVLAATAAVVAAPLAVYYGSHWSAFSFRVDMVSLMNPWVNAGDPWGLLGRNLLGTAGMFAGQGDPDPQYNVATLPVFPPALAALFVVGLGLAIWRARRPAYGLWLAWLVIMLLPGVLSANSPHFARQAGIIPAVYVFPALALWAAWRWAGPPGPPMPGGARRWRRALAPVVGLAIVAVVVSAAAGTVGAYFGRPDAPGPLLLGRVERLADLPGLGPTDEVYVAGSEETAEIGSYLSRLGPRPRFTQGFHSLLLPRDPARTTYLVEQDWWWLTAEQLLWARYDLEPQAAPPGLERFRVLRLRERPLPAGAPPSAPWLPLPAVRWAVGVRLVGYGLPAEARPGEVVGVTLRWRVEAPAADDPGQDYTFAVGLIDEAGDGVAGRDWLGHPTAAWREGDEVVSWFDLCLPPTLPPGDLRATVALYSRADFVRRPLLDAAGAPLGDQLTFGSLPVDGLPQDPPCGQRVHPALPPS